MKYDVSVLCEALDRPKEHFIYLKTFEKVREDTLS